MAFDILREAGEKIELLPKQKKFLVNCLYNQKFKFLWYIGGFGSGKSFVGVLAGIIMSFMYPKNLGIISRGTLVDLKNTTLRTFMEVCDILGLVEGTHFKMNSHENRLTFENGSEILFTGLDDIQKIKGIEPGWFYIDEVDEVDPEVFDVFQRRLRNKHTDRRIGFITSNSEGKNWTYQKFIKGDRVSPKYRETYYTIRASSLENKFLPDDYIDNLLSFDDDYFKRYVLGEFNVFEGQIYDELDEDVHIIDDFAIPEDRGIAYGHDHGLSNPTAFVEGRLDQEGNIYITWEHYMGGKAISFHANVMKERRKDLALPMMGQPEVISDPSIFANTQLPTPEKPYPWSIADEFMEQGIHPVRGNNSVLAGINRTKELLKFKKIFIFKSCKDTILEAQNYRWEKNNHGIKKEAPIKKSDHLLDAMRYLIMAKLPPATKKKAPGMMTIAELVSDDIKYYNKPRNEEEIYDII